MNLNIGLKFQFLLLPADPLKKQNLNLRRNKCKFHTRTIKDFRSIFYLQSYGRPETAEKSKHKRRKNMEML